MKTLTKAIIATLLALLAASCSDDYDEVEPDVYYYFEGKTWSKIEESTGYYHFVCYDFYKDGTYTYWFYEDDRRTETTMYTIERGHWDAGGEALKNQITLWNNGGSDTYNAHDFLQGLTEYNSPEAIDNYIRLIDDLYLNF